MLPHPLDLIALILGILFVLRQMDIGARTAEHYPAVPAADFERWKKRAASAYRLGSSACFGKVLIDLLVSRLFVEFAPPAWVRWPVGLSLDAAWVGLVVWAWLRSRAARALARELGIERLPEQSASS